MNTSIKTQFFPIPEAIVNAKSNGQFKLAVELIDNILKSNLPSQLLRERLKLERHNILATEACFPFNREKAEALLKEAYPNRYKDGMIDLFVKRGDVAYIFKEGEIFFEKRLVEGAAIRCEELKEKGVSDAVKKRIDNMNILKQKGKMSAVITVKESLKVTDTALIGTECFVNLPLARKRNNIKDIEILEHSNNLIGVDDEYALMRTVQFKDMIKSDTEFSLTFRYKIAADYISIPDDYDFTIPNNLEDFLSQEPPHIVSTPYLKALLKEIIGDESSNWKKVKLIYYWITSHINYSFMRHYALLDCIPEYATINNKADCGVYALTFITLCRLAGIPAKWQSGWSVNKNDIGPHDWAEVYLGEKYGFRPVDCSFGGSAYRCGEEELRAYYLGNLDINRMIANDKCMLCLSGKKAYPWDPVDNQVGEVEYEEKGLFKEQFETELKVISFTENC